MVTDAGFAAKITELLNAAATATNSDFQFAVYANEGEYKGAVAAQTQRELPTPLVNGTLVRTSSQIVPLQLVKSYTASQLLNFLVLVKNNDPSQGIDEQMAAILYFVEANAGLGGTLTDDDGNNYAFTLATQLPSVGQMSNDIGLWYVPVTMFLSWQLIENGVISNNITLTINGTPAIVTSGAAKRTRIPQTDPRGTSEEMQTVIGQQGLTIQAVVPYTTDGVAATLVSDLLIGSLDTTYEVEYSDGVVKTSSGDNPSWLMVATEISLNVVAGTVASVNVTLVIAASDVYSTTGA